MPLSEKLGYVTTNAIPVKSDSPGVHKSGETRSLPIKVLFGVHLVKSIGLAQVGALL
jgi:hypothetical protein